LGSGKKKNKGLGEERRMKNLVFGLYLSHMREVLWFLMFQKEVEVVGLSYKTTKCSILWLDERISYLDLIDLGRSCCAQGRSQEEVGLGFL